MTTRQEALQRLRWLGKLTLIGSLNVAVVMLVARARGVVINATPSLPLGLYVRDADGQYVTFCPDDGGLSAERGYRAKGVCEDGRMPLLKRIAAVEGDRVEVSAEGVRVNGALIEGTAPLDSDRNGRELKVWKYGEYRLKPGEIWVVSQEPRGYDSRYFGPVRHIRMRLRALWTP